jgi:hypothetical protein
VMDEQPKASHCVFEGSAAVPYEARHLVRDALTGAPDEGVAIAELLASELVTSAVLRGSPRIAVAVQPLQSGVRIEVTELTPAVGPEATSVGDVDPVASLGSLIVDVLASRHGHEMRSDGMATWVELAINQPPIPWGRVPGS